VPPPPGSSVHVPMVDKHAMMRSCQDTHIKFSHVLVPRTILHTRKHTPTIPKNRKKLNIKDKDRSHKTRCKCNGGTSKIANEEEGSDWGRRSTCTNRRAMDGLMDRIPSLSLSCVWTVMDGLMDRIPSLSLSCVWTVMDEH
jgi:hypothetical protein